MEPTKHSPSLSVAIISHNEETRISACIQSVSAIATEVIVIDSGSKDRTVEIAESAGAKVYFEEWRGFVSQRNFALSKCSCDWVMFVDCDEVLTEELRNSIVAALKTEEFNGYKIKFVTFFMDRWIMHAWSSEWHTRLVKRNKGSWTGYDVSETLECREPIGKLSGDALHYTYVDFEHHVRKGIFYAALGGSSLCKKGKKVRFYMLFLNPLWCFLKHYFLKLGFLDGFQGFVISLTSMQHNFYKYLIAWEIQHRAPATTNRQDLQNPHK